MGADEKQVRKTGIFYADQGQLQAVQSSPDLQPPEALFLQLKIGETEK